MLASHYLSRDLETGPRSDSEDTELIPSVGDLQRTARSTLRWWKDEYFYCLYCLAAAAGLVGLLCQYNKREQPSFGALDLSTVVVAIMSIYRVALKAIVETTLSQGAWIWVSAARRRRTKKAEAARLEDFRMFDEASRGLWGSICLVWRLRGTHLACIGAGIIILIHGFETFSQQMVTLQEKPKLARNVTSPPAPPPPRSETWGKDNVVTKGFRELSTKAAVYDGIMAAHISDLTASCETSNCTWPIFPSLAICGDCLESLITRNCDLQDGCTFTTSPNVSITIPSGNIEESHFTIAPAYNTRNSSFAYFSSFDILSATKSSSTDVFAYSCALWFCLNSYNITVQNGQYNSTTVATWSKVALSPETSAHFDEWMFVDIPLDMNTNNATRYSIRDDALIVLQNFMNSKTWGNSTNIAGNVDYSSDWVQAMQNASAADINTWMSRLTLSMTNAVRQSGAVDKSKMLDYVGSAYVMAEYVHVEWFWVIYPVSLMFLAFGYLAQTVWETARDEVSAWKGDCLPMLFANIDKNIQKIVGRGMDVPGGLDERVGRTEIELVRKQDGAWLFKVPQGHFKLRRP